MPSFDFHHACDIQYSSMKISSDDQMSNKVKENLNIVDIAKFRLENSNMALVFHFDHVLKTFHLDVKQTQIGPQFNTTINSRSEN